MAVAPGPSVRPPTTASQKLSRLPLYRSRPSTDKSSPALSELSPTSHTESSHKSVFTGANKRSERLINGSRPKHKTTQVGPNRTTLQDRQNVADKARSHRRPQPQPQPRSRRRNATCVDGVSPATATAQNHIGNSGIVSDMKYDRPSCGVRMSALRSAGREQQSPIPSNRHTTAAPLSCNAGVHLCRPGRPRDTALSHHASTSSIDSTSSEQPQRRALVAPRRPARPPASSSATDDNGHVADRQHNRSNRDSSASHFRQNSVLSRCVVSSETGEIISSMSESLDSQHLLATDQQTDKLQRRSDRGRSTSDECGPADIVRNTGHPQRSTAATVESQRHYYHLWRPSETDVNDRSIAGSVSTIASIDSLSSSGTLTDDADESESESTTTVGRNMQRRDRGQPDTSTAFSVGPAAQPSYRSGHQTRTKLPSHSSSCASSSLSESPSAPSATSMVGSRRLAKNYSEDAQRISNFGITRHAPAAVSTHTTSPSAQPQNCASPRGAANRPRNRPSQLASDELVKGSRSNSSSSPRRLLSESTTAVTTNATRHVARPSSVAAAVGRYQHTVFAERSSVQMHLSPVLNSTAVTPPNSPPHYRVQTRQTAAVKKASSTAELSKSKSSVSHLPVNTHAESKISPALRGYRPAHRTAGDTRLHTNIVDKDNRYVTDDRELVDKSDNNSKRNGNTTAGVKAARGALKPFTAAVIKHVNSSRSETVHSMDNSHQAKSARDTQTPSTRSTKTQTSSTVVTRSADSGGSNDPTAVIKRPPPSPSKLRKPGFIPVLRTTADRRRVTDQRRPASMDCSALNFVHQQPVDVWCKKSDSCTNVADVSAPIEQSRKPAKGVLNKNTELAKSYDCIAPLSNDSQRPNSDEICSQIHGSSTSLVDLPPRKLVKPYSVINRCSTFGRKMTALKEVHPTTTGCIYGAEIENKATSNRSSLASQVRAPKLSDLPEVDEFECSCQMSANDQLSTDKGNVDSDGGRRQLIVEKTTTVESPYLVPNVHQKPTEVCKYRTEYLTFLDVVEPKDDNKLTVETVRVASANNNSSSAGDCVSITIKDDKNDTHNSCSCKTKLPGNCSRQESHHSTHNFESVRSLDNVEHANKSCISAVRSVVLSTEIPTVLDARATAETADNYVVTYESDNIVVLDREPVIDCLTPDGDVVNTTVPADSVGAVAGEGGLLRTLPLSESGYDTWKSSQGSVAVATACTGSTCVAVPDFSAEQYQKHEEDGTLRGCDCNNSKTQSAQPISETNVYTEGSEICRREESDLLALFRGEGDLYGESTNTVAGASVTVAVKDGDKYSESSSRDDDSRRVAEGAVEDSALRDAQMFASICSDVTEPVVDGASFRSKSFTANSASSQGSGPSCSPPDSAAFGLADLSDICFSSLTMPSNDSDILSACRGSPYDTAHLERFDEEAHNVSLLLPGMGHYCQHEDMEINRVSDDSTVRVQFDTLLYPVVVSTRNVADNFDTDENAIADVKPSSERHRVFSKEYLQMNFPGDDTDCIEPSSSSAITAPVSDSESLDTYETICDDLLESVEANTSDSEIPRPSSSTSQAAAPCSTDVDHHPDDKSPERSEKLTSTNDRDRTLTKVVAVSSSVSNDCQSTHSGLSTLNSCSSPLSASVTGCPSVTTLRRVRSNFSVVYRQTTSQPSVSQSWQSTHGGYVDAKASAHKTLSHEVEQEPETVGCRRALAVLASRLDDHGRRCLAETNLDGHVMSAFQSAAVDRNPDVDTASPAVSLSSKVRPVTSSLTVIRDNESTTSRSDVGRHSDLQSTKSPLNVSGVTPDSAQSKLPMLTTASTHGSVSKKPSAFRRLLSSKLTNAVRRSQTK